MRTPIRCHLLGHRWVRTVNFDWNFARCTRCGRERELDDLAFMKTLGEKPPYLMPPTR